MTNALVPWGVPDNPPPDRAPSRPDEVHMQQMVAELAKRIAIETRGADPRHNVAVTAVIGAFVAEKRAQFAAGMIGHDQIYNVELALRQFVEWFGDGPVSSCDPQDMRDWKNEHPRWISQYTLIQKVNTVAGAFNWALNRGMILVNPYARIPKPTRPLITCFTAVPEDQGQPARKRKRKRRLPRYLRWPDAMKLIEWCEEAVIKATKRRRDAAVRDLIIIRVGLFLGLRCSEIINLDVTDIDLDRQAAMVREGKGCKDRCVTIPDKLLPFIRELIGDRTTGVLIHKKGKRCFRRTIGWRIVRTARLAGIPIHVHPHMLRHTYATRFLETGGNIRSLQSLLGHADLQQTAVYLDVDPSRFKQEVDRM